MNLNPVNEYGECKKGVGRTQDPTHTDIHTHSRSGVMEGPLYVFQDPGDTSDLPWKERYFVSYPFCGIKWDESMFLVFVYRRIQAVGGSYTRAPVLSVLCAVTVPREVLALSSRG